MEELVKKLKEKKYTISSCESLTGGMFASSIVNVSGASEVLVGGYVTYMDMCKKILVDDSDILEKYGAISFQMAYAMAKKVKDDLKSDVAVSFTGNAGPNPSENKEVGLVYSCIIIKDKVYQYKDNYAGNRTEIRMHCLEDAKKRIIENL